MKHLRRRQYDTVIIEMDYRSLCLALLQSCTDYSLSVALWITRRFGLYDGPCLNLLRGDRVLIPVPSDCKSGTPSALWDLSSRTGLCVAQPTLMDVPLYFWYTTILLYMFVLPYFFMTFRFGWPLVLSLYKEDCLQIFKCVSFWLHGCCG